MVSFGMSLNITYGVKVDIGSEAEDRGNNHEEEIFGASDSDSD